MTTVLTYGTFDLFHVGHVNLLERIARLGDRVVVGVSTDEFNAVKGKRSVMSYADRSRIVSAVKGVDLVIPENDWGQKPDDIREHGVDLFVMGDDWAGKFDELTSLCEVRYLPRTAGVSTTGLKQMLKVLDPSHLDEMKQALDTLTRLLAHYGELR